MTLKIDVDEGAARWPEIVEELEAGREVVIARGAISTAIVRSEPLLTNRDRARAAVEAIRASRKNFTPTTMEEIIAWRDEDRR